MYIVNTTSHPLFYYSFAIRKSLRKIRFWTGVKQIKLKILYVEEISRLEIDEKREPFSDVQITFGQGGAINEDNTIKL